MLSTHKVEVSRIEVSPHPNADKLEVGTIHGYTCCVQKGLWKTGDLVAFVPPDSVVDVTRPEFNFLKAPRIKAMKLRGVKSFGLVIPPPPGAKENDDAAEYYGVSHYEPEMRDSLRTSGINLGSGEAIAGPTILVPRYDLESGRRYSDVLITGEPVHVTEKIHGANARYVYHNGVQYCGSRNEWKAEVADFSHVTMEYLKNLNVPEERATKIVENCTRQSGKKTLWWEVFHRTPQIGEFCRANPGVALFGEVYGNVGGFPYDTTGFPKFRAFDILENGEWKNPYLRLPTELVVPQFGVRNFDFAVICDLAEGQSSLGNHVREGVVVKPVVERTHSHIGRVALKFVGAGYLERN